MTDDEELPGPSVELDKTLTAAKSPADRLRIKTVLVIEDHKLNMKFFGDVLVAHGYDIIQTAEGMEGLRLARTRRPDLILLDIQLPDVSGLEVSQWLKEDDDLRSIPIVAVTAFAMKGDEERIREAGCDAYLTKPVPVRLLMETLQSFLS